MYGMFVTRVVRERVESCPFFNFCANPCHTTLHVFTKIGVFLVLDFHLFFYSYTPPYTCNVIFHISIVVYENCNCSSVNLFGHFSSIYFELTSQVSKQVLLTHFTTYLILDMKTELEKHFKLHKVHKKTEVTANRQSS